MHFVALFCLHPLVYVPLCCECSFVTLQNPYTTTQQITTSFNCRKLKPYEIIIITDNNSKGQRTIPAISTHLCPLFVYSSLSRRIFRYHLSTCPPVVDILSSSSLHFLQGFVCVVLYSFQDSDNKRISQANLRFIVSSMQTVNGFEKRTPPIYAFTYLLQL